MPWGIQDVEKHNKGLSDQEKKQWVEIANSALASGDDDGTAIKKANGIIKHNRIVSHTESLLYKKAEAMIEAIRMQQIAAVFEGALDNEPEGVLGKHGWKQTAEKGDRRIYTHPSKTGHEIHVDSHGGWRHYDGDNCLQAGFTGEKMRKHLGESDETSRCDCAWCNWVRNRHPEEKNLPDPGHHIKPKKEMPPIKEEILREADPKPRVERDIDGKPIVPNRQHFLMYFQDMQAGHIKDALRSAHERWQAAEKTALAARAAAQANKSQSAKDQAAMAAAHLKALGIELSMGNLVLKQKQSKASKEIRKGNKKIKSRARTFGKFVNTATKGQSPLVKLITKHAVKALTSKTIEPYKPKTSHLAPPKVAPRSA